MPDAPLVAPPIVPRSIMVSPFQKRGVSIPGRGQAHADDLPVIVDAPSLLLPPSVMMAPCSQSAACTSPVLVLLGPTTYPRSLIANGCGVMEQKRRGSIASVSIILAIT